MSWRRFDPDALEVAREVLTERQLEVLRLRVDGNGVKWIGAVLELDPSTVKAHLAAVRRSLRAAGLVEGADGGWYLSWELVRARRAAQVASGA